MTKLYHIVHLKASDKNKVETHFNSLDPESLGMRFGYPISASGIKSYLKTIDFSTNHLIGVVNEDGLIVGLLHMSVYSAGQYSGRFTAEAGFSILQKYQGLGIGQVLMSEARQHCSNYGISEIIVHFAPKNTRMKKLAQKNRAVIQTDLDQSTGSIETAHFSAHQFDSKPFPECANYLR